MPETSPLPDPVLLSVTGGVATITLNRPRSMNAVNPALAAELGRALDTVSVDESVGAVIITGAGDRAFCVGADLKDPPVDPNVPYGEYAPDMERVFDMGAKVRACPKPVVAAINGYAIAGGFDIAIASDFRVAVEEATFSASYIGVGLVPGDGGAYYLPRLLGEAKAKELLLLTDRFGSDKALELGLVNKVVRAEELIMETTALARRLAGLPRLAMRLTKAQLNDSFETSLAHLRSRMVVEQRMCLESSDYREAQAAFREGRQPVFNQDESQ